MSSFFLFLFKVLKFPLLLPADDGHTVLKLDGEPHVAGIDRVIRTPDVGHEDVLDIDH